MSGVLRTVAIVAAVVAISFAIPGVGTAITSAIGFGAISATTAATIAGVAAAVSTIASAGAAMLQKPPEMKGSVNEVIIGANMPIPYAMGRTFVGGMKVYDDSSSGVNGSPNKDRHQVFVGTHGGPIEGFEKFLGDYSVINFASMSGGLISGVASGYYGADGGYMWMDSRKGNRPETRLSSPAGRSAMRNWPSTAKLSGMAAWAVTMEFDEEGERFSGGVPAMGMVAKWVKNYDPRKDSTYPGGSGTQSWTDESTWAFGAGGSGFVAQGENAALHALTYARGRFMGPNNIKVLGCGIPKDAIDIAAFVELANICDANGWTCGGAIYEGPGTSRWDNLKRILAAAAAVPAWVGGKLTVKYSSPKVAVATFTSYDLADGDIEVQAMQGWKDRHNTIIPRVRSEPHRWEYVQLDAITNPTYLAEDGEIKSDEVQYDLCQDPDVGAQLAAYDLVNRREFGPIKFNAKPYWSKFRPGEAIEIDLPEVGLENQLAIIESRSIDPGTGTVSMVLVSETSAKHAYVLGQSGVAPPTPSIVPPEEVDAAVTDLGITTAEITQRIIASAAVGMTFSITSAGALTISNHTRVYPDKTVSVTGTSGTPIATGATSGKLVFVYYDDPQRVGGAVTFQYLVLPATGGDASSTTATDAHPYRHFLFVVTVPASGSGGGGSDPGSGGGGSGLPCVTTDTMIELYDGTMIPAGEVERYMQIRTRHEETYELGVYHVEAVQTVADQDVWKVEIGGKVLRATGDHRIRIGDEWVKARDLGMPDGKADVVKMTVSDAHTYMSNDLLSHNAKIMD